MSAPVWADVSGPIRVIDGDTLDVGGTRVRLHGIDAPERDQMCGGNGVPGWRCGAWVVGEVRARYQGQWAACVQTDYDQRYERIVAKCFVDGQDIGQRLVRDGLAFAYRKYSKDYDLDEKGAAVNDRGLHGQGVQAPSAYRTNKQHARSTVNLQTAPEGCVIKGNINSDDVRIYHVPGQRDYERTTIKTEQGERWFCTEDEALSAGWRRAKR
ncbi:thermonuclease family protein [Mesobacterium sp. TK19101]|uniref:Thermonuclease family protein n=1 Tax=Mesobacterium hydrothermale TaxID=3111907 RepID=A0ABU6HD23_9RHOB|nr:thermonuclease family protein [Mesobacterium sp. TK19101]MEC3860368.1 thermonuclease family protein [Mesobacterium sp. TK19101]